MRKAVLVGIWVALCGGLAACGLKGDLYLPKPKEEAAPATAPAGPATPAPRPEDERQDQQGRPAQPPVE